MDRFPDEVRCRGLELLLAIAVIAAAGACERTIARPPSIAAPATASPNVQWRVTHQCNDQVVTVGGKVQPRVSPEALASHRIEDAQTGRILYFEILKTGEASFYDNQQQRPGEAAKPYCGWTSIGQSQVEKLEQTFVDHHFCSIPAPPKDTQGAQHRLKMRHGRVNCEVTVTTLAMDQSADAAGTYRAVNALEPRCPNDGVWPCEVPGSDAPAAAAAK